MSVHMMLHGLCCGTVDTFCKVSIDGFYGGVFLTTTPITQAKGCNIIIIIIYLMHLCTNLTAVVPAERHTCSTMQYISSSTAVTSLQV
jgi:hypothetical protein